jgi:hypothetical protein
LRELQDEARTAGKALTIHVEKFNPRPHPVHLLRFSPVRSTTRNIGSMNCTNFELI